LKKVCGVEHVELQGFSTGASSMRASSRTVGVRQPGIHENEDDGTRDAIIAGFAKGVYPQVKDIRVKDRSAATCCARSSGCLKRT